MSIRNDEPIKNVMEDDLGFRCQAAMLARLVSNPENDHLCVGITGQWGSGKTSLLNMIKFVLNTKNHLSRLNYLDVQIKSNKFQSLRIATKKQIQKENDELYLYKKIIGTEEVFTHIEQEIYDNKVIWFDPWFYGSEEMVIKAFFYRIAKELMDEDKELAKLFLKLAVVMVGSPDLPESLPVVGNAFKVINYGRNLLNWMSGDDGSVMDFSDIKNKITAKLGETKKRIVIIIDDLDRLQVDEALTMLKVIRLVTEFGVNFVIGYDEETLSATIDKNCGCHGREYIRKMINVPTYQPLWEIDKTNKENFFDKYLWNPAIKSDIKGTCWQRHKKIDKKDQSNNILYQDEGYSKLFNILDYLVKTPRQLINFGNIFQNGYNSLKPKIDPSDYLLLCLIKLYYPRLFIIFVS